MDHLLFNIRARCERAEGLKVTEDARRWLHGPVSCFVRCVQALVFLRMSPRRHSSAEIRTSAVILSACRQESASSSSCCPAAHDQACSLLLASKWSSVVSLAFAKPFGLCGNLKWKEATVSFSFLQAVVWRLRPMILYSLVSCFVE